MRPMALALSSGLACLVIGNAHAQVVTPPPPPKAPTPEYVPPAAPTRAPRPATTQSRPTRSSAAARDAALPELPYRKPQCGIEVPADQECEGPVMRYPRPMQYEILRFNPTTSLKMQEGIDRVADERALKLEPLVIEHLDTVVEVMDGMLLRLSLQDLEGFQEVANAIKPLRLETNLNADLRAAGVLTRIQAGFQDKLSREYQNALRAEFAAEGDQAGGQFIQFIFHDELLEPVNVLEGLLLESTLRMDEVLAGLDIPSEAASELKKLHATPEDLEDEESWTDRINAIRLAWRPLSAQQKQAFLKAVIGTRPEGATPVRREIRLDNPSKTYQEGEHEIKINKGTAIPNTGGETDLSIKKKQEEQSKEEEE